MTLNEQINNDLKTAMKSGEKTRVETLRLLRAHMIELSKRGENQVITPDEELAVLLGAIKKRKEAIDIFEKNGRQDLALQEKAELDIISAYLPKQMSAEEAGGVIDRIMQETGANNPKDFGKVMPLAMKELKGKCDGKIVQELVKQKLGVSS